MVPRRTHRVVRENLTFDTRVRATLDAISTAGVVAATVGCILGEPTRPASSCNDTVHPMVQSRFRRPGPLDDHANSLLGTTNRGAASIPRRSRFDEGQNHLEYNTPNIASIAGDCMATTVTVKVYFEAAHRLHNPKQAG